MAAGNVNIIIGCERCTFADYAGRGCAHGLLFPIMVLMSGKDCPNYKRKTTEQIEEQLKHMRE